MLKTCLKFRIISQPRTFQARLGLSNTPARRLERGVIHTNALRNGIEPHNEARKLILSLSR